MNLFFIAVTKSSPKGREASAKQKVYHDGKRCLQTYRKEESSST